MSLYINFDKYEETKRQIESLVPTFGYCFFIDITGSTSIKDEKLSKWIIYIYNTFANVRTFLYDKFEPIKILGDGLLYFIPEADMKDETVLTLFHGLTNISGEKERYFKEVKIGAAFCRHAYDITFSKGNRDIYGKDIDLTSRLAGFAESKEIVMNKEFVNKLREEYGRMFNKASFPEVEEIKGPELRDDIKGLRDKVEIFRVKL